MNLNTLGGKGIGGNRIIQNPVRYFWYDFLKSILAFISEYNFPKAVLKNKIEKNITIFMSV